MFYFTFRVWICTIQKMLLSNQISILTAIHGHCTNKDNCLWETRFLQCITQMYSSDIIYIVKSFFFFFGFRNHMRLPSCM